MVFPLAHPADLAHILAKLKAENIPSAHHIEPEILAELYAEYGRKPPSIEGLVDSMTEFWELLNKKGPAPTSTGVVDILGRLDYIRDSVWEYETYHQIDYTETSGSITTSSSRHELEYAESDSSLAQEGGTREIEGLFNELSHQRSRIQDLEEDLENSNKQREMYKATVKRMRKESTDAQKEGARMQKENARLKKENARLQKEHEALQQRVSDHARQVTALQRERDRAVSHVENKQMEEENKTTMLQDHGQLSHQARRACAKRIVATVGRLVIDAIRALRETDVLTAVEAFEAAAAAVMGAVEDSLKRSGQDGVETAYA
ncbi:hypothetical protein HII31_02701 [Pseudocercospora fuligena]|uniref:Uncharacterized protein n=1 Tax=Pseudocercospora fuligena TaxID=685502 RepID=A0A8H6RR15_9PEZI|nr:hypothetical protein HII31_02701 [Pseudocercospora fuligena]